ncbi:hypothetical protein PG993_010519 [Apiospora rasikravindrae]|uniref:Uncharacterized protein n=1 Tax=Apiospora rasikravindrae TaxID=990691 RepID=A0ABR1SP75_9PEZI
MYHMNSCTELPTHVPIDEGATVEVKPHDEQAYMSLRYQRRTACSSGQHPTEGGHRTLSKEANTTLGQHGHVSHGRRSDTTAAQRKLMLLGPIKTPRRFLAGLAGY